MVERVGANTLTLHLLSEGNAGSCCCRVTFVLRTGEMLVLFLENILKVVSNENTSQEMFLIVMYAEVSSYVRSSCDQRPCKHERRHFVWCRCFYAVVPIIHMQIQLGKLCKDMSWALLRQWLSPSLLVLDYSSGVWCVGSVHSCSLLFISFIYTWLLLQLNAIVKYCLHWQLAVLVPV